MTFMRKLIPSLALFVLTLPLLGQGLQSDEEAQPEISPSVIDFSSENQAPLESKTNFQNIPELFPQPTSTSGVTLEFPSDTTTQEPTSISDDELISVDFPEEEIRTIIRNVSDLYELNVIIPDSLIGSTSIKLRNVTWRQIFKIVLKPVGFTFTEDRNIIYIVSLDELNQEPMALRTYSIKYATAEEVATSLRPLIEGGGGGGQIQVDKRSNSIIIRDRPSTLAEIEQLLATSPLDKPREQVLIETKLVEMNDNDDGALGFDWSSLAALDVFKTGFDYLYEPVNVGSRTTTNAIPNSLITTPIPQPSGTRAHIAFFNANQFNVLLNAIETKTDSKLVSNPTIITLNNQTATMLVADKYPVITTRFNSQTGTYEASDPIILDLGLTLEVTPFVNMGADLITLHLKPKVSRKGADVVSLGVTYPIEEARQFDTWISVRNGYTAALSGFIRRDIQDVVNKVPIFGDIPGLGKLFSSKAKVHNKRNLIMFITARTLSPEGATYKDIIDPRLFNALKLNASDVPGYAFDNQVPGLERMSPAERKLIEDLQKERNKESDEKARLQLETNLIREKQAFASEMKKVKNEKDKKRSREARNKKNKAQTLSGTDSTSTDQTTETSTSSRSRRSRSR
ncbi:MAG: hypothetical protein AUJ82_08490 [Verrucomicrobia bacterium CG1_02_43_26]|nr:MAG: hypothetical protein AUJ82_08490 [Verrucomicrobia bacterium CG1_02_43_26]